MGTLSGLRVVEMAGLGPAPFCGMMLADMGAEVVQIRRKRGKQSPLVSEFHDILNRGRIPLELDMKSQDDMAAATDLIRCADVLIEGYRPGVMERLGLGPEECQAFNPGLVYGRITGWGQEGPLAMRAGHDINYLGLSGALAAIGRKEHGPVAPLNLVADFGGGGMLLTVGILAALLEREKSGKGQVVDAAMIDGCALQLSLIHSLKNMGQWVAERESNMLDGGAPFYDVYQCADGAFIAVGAIEPDFYRAFLAACGINEAVMSDQWNRSLWPVQKKIVAAAILAKSRDEWMTVFKDIDACVTPVLALDEAPQHIQNTMRKTYCGALGGVQPAAAPRFSRTPSAVGSIYGADGDQGKALMKRWHAEAAMTMPTGK